MFFFRPGVGCECLLAQHHRSVCLYTHSVSTFTIVVGLFDFEKEKKKEKKRSGVVHSAVCVPTKFVFNSHLSSVFVHIHTQSGEEICERKTNGHSQTRDILSRDFLVCEKYGVYPRVRSDVINSRKFRVSGNLTQCYIQNNLIFFSGCCSSPKEVTDGEKKITEIEVV